MFVRKWLHGLVSIVCFLGQIGFQSLGMHTNAGNNSPDCATSNHTYRISNCEDGNGMIMIKIKLNSSSSLSRYTFFLRIPSKYSTKLIYHHQKSDHFILSSFPVYALMLLLSKHHHNSHTTQLTTRHINQQSYTHKLKLHLA